MSSTMKSTGVVRKIDDLGRIVLPRELRKTLEINERDSLEIFVDGPFIMLQKYEPSCIFCGNADEVNGYKGKNICARCMNELRGEGIGKESGEGSDKES